MILLKTCTICKNIKNIEDFSILTRSKDGHYPQCKICKADKDKEFYKHNKDEILEKSNKRYEETKGSRIPLTEEQKLIKNEKSRNWKKNNEEWVREYNHQYKNNFDEIIKKQRSQWRTVNKSKINEYNRALNKKDPLFKIKKNLRNRVREVINNKNFDKDLKLSEYLGCSFEELIKHIESQFTDKINWNNKNEWHIDHKLPISNATNINQLNQLSNYLNLRPLLAKDNLIKNDKASICWQKLKRDILIKEDKLAGYNFDLIAKDFTLNQEKFTSEHREFIKKYEWLGTIGYSPKFVFTARHDNKLAGVIIIADPIMNQFGNKEALIARGACSSWAPKHLNSRLLMFSCRWMITNTEKRIFTAYSDPKAGEIGTIYQACNFDYLGINYGSKRLFLLPNGKQVGSRYFTTLYCLKKWAKILDITWEKSWNKQNGYPDIKLIPNEIYKQLINYANKFKKSCKKIKQDRKGKYVLLLNYGKNKINKTWIGLKYPKGYNSKIL